MFVLWVASMWREYYELGNGIWLIVSTQQPNPLYAAELGIGTFMFHVLLILVISVWILQFQFCKYQVVLILRNKTTIGMLAH